MAKLALILHGWPRYELKDYFLTKFLERKGYEVLTPNLFTKDYIYNAENIIQDINCISGGRVIDLIVGISMGGLVLPHVAKNYPDAKLIFIATSAYLETNSKFFNIIIHLLRYPFFVVVLGNLLKLPDALLRRIYMKASPYKGCDEDSHFYCEDMNENIRLIKSIPASKDREIFDFVTTIDNKNILSSLKNHALIFSGENDLLMPKERGEELHKLLTNSRLVLTKGEHFDVFGIEEMKELENFI